MTTIDSNLNRPRYFDRQQLGSDDLALEQAYQDIRVQQLNQHLHGWGIVCGALVAEYQDLNLVLGEGFAISPTGKAIHIPYTTTLNLETLLADACGEIDNDCKGAITGSGEAGPAGQQFPLQVYLVAAATVKPGVPRTGIPEDCGHSGNALEYSRLCDTVCLSLVCDLSPLHQPPITNCDMLRRFFCSDPSTVISASVLNALFPCPPQVSEADDYVVIATLTINNLPGYSQPEITSVQYGERRMLASVQMLQNYMSCLCTAPTQPPTTTPPTVTPPFTPPVTTPTTPPVGTVTPPFTPPFTPPGGGFTEPFTPPITPPGGGFTEPFTPPFTPPGGGFTEPFTPPGGGFTEPFTPPGGGFTEPFTPPGGGFTEPFTPPGGGFTEPFTPPGGGFTEPFTPPGGGFTEPFTPPGGGFTEPGGGFTQPGGGVIIAIDSVAAEGIDVLIYDTVFGNNTNIDEIVLLSDNDKKILHDGRVNSLLDLYSADTGSLAESLGISDIQVAEYKDNVLESMKRAEPISLSGEIFDVSKGMSLGVEAVHNIGTTRGRALSAAGYASVADVANSRPEVLAKVLRVSEVRAGEMIVDAQTRMLK